MKDNNEPLNTNKPSKIWLVIRWIGKLIIALLLILLIVFQFPWKVIALFAIILVVCTILPKRYRKWFWITTGTAVLIIIIWILLPEDDTGWRPYTFDEEIVALEAKYEIPDEENAAFSYYEIFDNLDMDANQPVYFRSEQPSSLDEFWLTKDHPETTEWLDTHKNTIEKLIETAQKDKCIFKLVTDPVTQSENSHSLAKIRQSVFLLLSIANNDVAEGRIDTALEKYLSNFKIANQLYQQPMLTHIMVSYAVKDKTIQMLNRFVIENQPKTEHIELISNTINIENNWSADWLRMLEYDKLFAKNYFALIAFEINTKGNLRFSRQSLFFDEQSMQNPQPSTYISGSLGKIRSIIRWFYVVSEPEQIADTIDSCFIQYNEMAEPDYNWNKQNSHQIYEGINYLSYVKFMINQNEFNYRQIYKVYLAHLTILRGSRLLIAIRQYKDKNNKWPDSLEEIKTAAPAEAFIDPSTGKQLQYENLGEQFSLSGDLINIWPFERKYKTSVMTN